MDVVSKRNPAPDGIDSLIARFQADGALHITSEGNTEEQVLDLEARLGYPLPAPYRTFLRQLGGGVYYMRHEIFGARRVMIHDIELVPDVMSFRHWVGSAVPDQWLPIERSTDGIYAIALGVPDPAPVRDFSSGTTYPDFAALLEVLTRSR